MAVVMPFILRRLDPERVAKTFGQGTDKMQFWLKAARWIFLTYAYDYARRGRASWRWNKADGTTEKPTRSPEARRRT